MARPPEWSGPRYVTRREVAAALSCCETTVSRHLQGYAVMVGRLVRYDLESILRDHALGTDAESP